MEGHPRLYHCIFDGACDIRFFAIGELSNYRIFWLFVADLLNCYSHFNN